MGCYDKARYDPVKLAGAAAAGMIAGALVDYLCFRSGIILILTIPGAFSSVIYYNRYSVRKRKEVLLRQFREMLLSLGGAMEAGYSMERGLRHAAGELERLYGPKSDMVWELKRIIESMELNGTAEEALEELAERSGLEDIRNFSQVFAAAYRGSGSISHVICLAARTMSRKHRTEEEIKTLTASRKMEQRILFVMPFALLAYLDLTSPGFLDIMYVTVAGRVIMALCLAAGAGSWAVAERMMRIDI